MVVDDAAGILVLRHADEVAGGDGEDGIEEVGLGAGDDGDSELEVAVWVCEVELLSVVSVWYSWKNG